jgi:uncharacterized protein YqcC (DUF446 family)
MAGAGRTRAKRCKPVPHARVAALIAAIEAEMKRIGLWQSEPLSEEARSSPAAFFGKTMTFPQWLQFVLVPRARQIIAERGSFPRRSDLAVMAVRNLDGMHEAEDLTRMLAELDRVVEDCR